ncbi:DUF3226 domain-containing protein [Campylobacter troglodytis]|uniref:DUF3226 domain-containing protein n=1 Tax=Campylobacter troglodytis TaxID=654363 RepID=UPI001C8E2461|nr:DUF3226 domain-containing protein [Campylobacter troglodytis]
MKQEDKMLIIVEGDTDKHFIESYCNYLSLKCEVFTSKGKDKSQKNENNGIQRVRQYIEKALTKGERILIIFDADDDKEKSLKNIHNQLDLLETSLKKQCESSLDTILKEQCEIFLIPNNQDKGNLETLLENIAKEKCILKCFDDYNKCITRLQNQNSKIKLPEKKSKVFAYLSSFDIKIDENFQLNEDIWDLQNPYLDNLKNFLMQTTKNAKIKSKTKKP